MDRLERFGAFLIQKVQIVDRLEHQPPPGNSHNPFNQEALMMLSLIFCYNFSLCKTFSV